MVFFIFQACRVLLLPVLAFSSRFGSAKGFAVSSLVARGGVNNVRPRRISCVHQGYQQQQRHHVQAAKQQRHASGIVSFSTIMTSTRLQAGLPLTTTISSSSLVLLPGLLSNLRGGGAAATKAAAFDMARESYKLQSMATYSTITALIMNASLRLYTSQKFAKKEGVTSTPWREHLFVALTTICILSGAFTAVMFNILGIYSKECLGIQNDVGYMAFQTATAIYRKWGFRTFLATCLSFVGSFLLSVYEKARAGSQSLKSRGLWIFIGSIVLAIMAAYEIQKILHLATVLIYTPEVCAKNHIA